MQTPRRVATRLFMVAIGVATLASGQRAYSQRSLRAQVVKLAKPYVDSNTVVGLSIGVIKSDETKTVHLGKTGEDGKRPTDNTVYEIGSISKVFTSLLLADAVTTGQLRLEQDVMELLPDGVKMPKWKDQSITLLDLSTHVSGLPRLADNMPFQDPKNPYADYSSSLAHQFLTRHELRRAPGEEYEYSNFAVSLLGHMVCEAAQKQSYETLLEQRITGPLKMNSTAVQLTPSMKKRFATPHSSPGTPTSGWDFADMPGAGGIRSTTRDMLLFAKANMRPPDGQLGEAIQLAWKEQDTSDTKMGLGWHLAGDGSTRWHNGGTGGFHSMLMVNRDTKAAVVLLTNTSSGEIDRLGGDVMKMLAGGEVEPRVFAKELKIDEDTMQRYVGRYELTPDFVFTVSVDQGKLMVGVTNQPTHRVYPKSKTKWFYKVVPAEITFQVNRAGECTALELFQNGRRQTAKRVK